MADIDKLAVPSKSVDGANCKFPKQVFSAEREPFNTTLPLVLSESVNEQLEKLKVPLSEETETSRLLEPEYVIVAPPREVADAFSAIAIESSESSHSTVGFE